MAEPIIRTYLADPWMYAYKSFCPGCKGQVWNRECKWMETGENVQDYVQRLQARHPKGAELKAKFIRQTVVAAAILAFLAGALATIAGYFASGMGLAMMLFALVMVLGTPAAFFLLLKLRGGI